MILFLFFLFFFEGGDEIGETSSGRENTQNGEVKYLTGTKQMGR